MSATTSLGNPAFEDRAPIQLPHKVRMRVLGAVMVGVFLAALDQTVVGTALPQIITDLGGNNLYTWAFTAYLLTSTISGPLYGKLSDLFGRRPIFLFGIGVFMLGSLLAGLSQEMWQLVAARGVQGLGAGALFPIALAVIGDLFAPSERGRYQGLFGAVFGLSVLVGPAIGGIITDTIGWSYVFFINLPIGRGRVLRGLEEPACLPPRRRTAEDRLPRRAPLHRRARPDPGRSHQQRGADWSDPTVGGLIAVGALILAMFVLVESRADEPIVPLELFRIRSFTISVAAVFLAAFGFFATVVFLPRWFQVVAGASATESGYQILPLLGGLIISAVVSGQIVSRTGHYRLLIFGALVTMAFGLWMLAHLEATTPLPVLWGWMFVTGLGVGPTFAVFTLIVQNGVPVARLGTATSNLTFFQQVGGTVGLAITGTIFGSRLIEELPGQLAAAEVPPEVAGAIAGGGPASLDALTGVGDLGQAILATLPAEIKAQVEPFLPGIVDAIYHAFSIAIASTFTLGIVAAAVAAGLVLLLKEAPATASAPVSSTPVRSPSADPTGS